MKIILIGRTNFTLAILKKILETKIFTIGGVVTTKKINKNHDQVDLTNECEKYKVPLLKISNINSTSTYKWIKNKKPDFIFCFGFSQLIRGLLIKNFKNKILGFHPADLPNNKGRHPIIWTIILGLKFSAVSFFLIDKTIDGGKIVLKKKFKIPSNTNATKLYSMITVAACKNLKKLKQNLTFKKFLRISKHNSSFWRKRSFCDGIIDWRMSADNIYRHFLALSKPYPGVYFRFNDRLFQIKDCKIKKMNKFKNSESGKIVYVSKANFVIKCGEDFLKIFKTKPNFKSKRNSYLI